MAIAPYGSWKSPITAKLVSSGGVALGEIQLLGNDTFWLEVRPDEQGRSVLVRRSENGEIRDVTGGDFNVRSRVHEYGGGAYLATDHAIYFSNFSDNRLYRQPWHSGAEPLTGEGPLRYADFVLDAGHHRLISVREDHSKAPEEAVNTLVSIHLDDGSQEIMVSGANFYATPRLSVDGKRLAWLTWNHPNMPWDGTELWVATVEDDGSLTGKRPVAGGADESIFQPEWSSDGTLYFVSDRTGWWNLYRESGDKIEAITQLETSFGVPQWVFRMSTYGLPGVDKLIALHTDGGIDHLESIDLVNEESTPIETPYSSLAGIQVQPGRAVFLGASAEQPQTLVSLDLKSGTLEVLKRSRDVRVAAAYLSKPEAIEFPTAGGQTAYGLYYAPRNPDFQAPVGELPPLIVHVHGGPTARAGAGFGLTSQFWTSRGFAYIDLNYRGSSGYGRQFRNSLRGQWGVVDVEDSVAAAEYAVSRGFANPDALLITGGSAGGYTTLTALALTDTFAGGASYFGIGDLESFVQDTHKFESRYTDTLVGALPGALETYRERSAMHHLEDMTAPVLLLQGLEDKIVPPNQAAMMEEALRQKGT
ncbi:MAG: S9 family peptidase, partial [Chloroflexota bacterium]